MGIMHDPPFVQATSDPVSTRKPSLPTCKFLKRGEGTNNRLNASKRSQRQKLQESYSLKIDVVAASEAWNGAQGLQSSTEPSSCTQPGSQNTAENATHITQSSGRIGVYNCGPQATSLRSQPIVQNRTKSASYVGNTDQMIQDAEVQEFARLERQIRVEVGDLLADLQQPDVLQPVVQGERSRDQDRSDIEWSVLAAAENVDPEIARLVQIKDPQSSASRVTAKAYPKPANYPSAHHPDADVTFAPHSLRGFLDNSSSTRPPSSVSHSKGMAECIVPDSMWDQNCDGTSCDATERVCEVSRYSSYPAASPPSAISLDSSSSFPGDRAASHLPCVSPPHALSPVQLDTVPPSAHQQGPWTGESVWPARIHPQPACAHQVLEPAGGTTTPRPLNIRVACSTGDIVDLHSTGLPSGADNSPLELQSEVDRLRQEREHVAAIRANLQQAQQALDQERFAFEAHKV